VEGNLKICKNEKDKMVEIWLTNAEKNDSAIEKELNRICLQAAIEKYKVIVFKSGTGNLYENTKELIFNNLRKGEYL